jgi:hypothetical protein
MKLVVIIVFIILYLWACRSLYLNLAKGTEYHRHNPQLVVGRAQIAQILCWIVDGLIFTSQETIPNLVFFLEYTAIFSPFGIAFFGGIMAGWDIAKDKTETEQQTKE